MALPDCIKNALVSGVTTATRSQYLFPSSFEAPALIASVFNNQLLLASGATALNIYKNNSAIYNQFGGRVQGGSHFRLPITKDDAQKRIHWQVDLLDHDGLVGGSFFFATDCEFAAVDDTIAVTVDVTDITTENQVIHLSGTSSANLGLLYTPSGNTMDEPFAFADGFDPDSITRNGYQASGTPTMDITIQYPSGTVGMKNYSFIVTDDCGNKITYSFILNVNIP